MRTVRLSVMCLAIWLIAGCAGTPTNKVAFYSTEAIGKLANTAFEAFNDYEARLAVDQLTKEGFKPNNQSVTARVMQNPDWQTFADLWAKYQAAYTVWCNGNAVAVTSTNAAGVFADPAFRQNAIQAAADLTAFVAKFCPSVQTVTVQPVIH